MEDDNLEKDKVWPPAPQHQINSNAADQNPIRSPQVTTAKELWQVRLFGVVMFVLFCGFSWFTKADYDAHRGISGKMVIALPAGVLARLAFMIEPRILLAGVKEAAPQPVIFKILGYAIGAVGVGIGFYILHTFF